jgi:hypothetical protein
MGASIADLPGEGLSKELKPKHRIEIGNVYRVSLGKKDGLTVYHEDEILSKYFIVIGVDVEGNVYGGLLISSEPPKNIPYAILMYQYQVKAENNTFLKWDSWVNCTKIYKSPRDKLTKNNFWGCLDKESRYYIISTILDESNPVITNKERKKYNIQLPEDPDRYF